MAFPVKIPEGMRVSGWELTSRTSHILESRCSDPRCPKAPAEDTDGPPAPDAAAAPAAAAAAASSPIAAPDEKAAGDGGKLCNFCKYSAELELPALPEEVYAESFLRLKHVGTGAVIEFNALDALRTVDPHHDLVKVAYADEWASARAGPAGTARKARDLTIHKPYDWTFTTEYPGSYPPGWAIGPTDEAIDYEALKRHEPILYHAMVNLYGDDFADNGEVELSVRIRAMPTSFFVLQRLVVRVDGVLLRVADTRLYHRFGTRHLLRECSLREQGAKELEAKLGFDAKSPAAAAQIYLKANLNQLIEMLPVVKSHTDKIAIPDVPAKLP